MEKSKRLFFLLVAFSFANVIKAASVDTINIYSNSMHKSSKCVIVLPDSYALANKQFPVVYLLHGYSGDYSDWIKKVPSIKYYADEFQIIIVCPDGHYNSWYIDSPVDSSIRYETYIGLEIPHYIDSAYHTIARRNQRAITGLSMGGQGALSIAWKHPDIFGAAGSMSGVQNLVPWKNSYELTRVLGDTSNNRNFQAYSVVNLVKKEPKQIPAIIIDCGISDPFIETNRLLNEELLEMKIPHDYTERNGTHNWAYWSNAIGFQLMFFHNYFNPEDSK